MLGKIKMELQYRGHQGFWHIYISNRIDYVIEDIDDCLMLFEVDFSGFSKMKSKKKVLIFQKKGFADSIFGYSFLLQLVSSNGIFLNRAWKTKIPEMMGFTGMLLMFISVAYCKGTRFLTGGDTEEVKYSHLSDDMVKKGQDPNMSIQQQICHNYSYLLYSGAVLFFSYLGNKMLGKYKERGEKMKAIRKLKKET